MARTIEEILLVLTMVLVASAGARAEGSKYATIVNPVRSRELWADKTLKPIVDQYGLLRKNNLAATWLIQDDVWDDWQLGEELKNFGQNQELGVFLEVSENLTKKARVYYPSGVPWYDPGAVFLSGYSRSERRKLMDTMIRNFKRVAGKWPESAGAWWIDSYSASYLKEKYGIKNLMIVADQRTTDNYGVSGQWWGVPYYPAKANILTPASNKKNKLDVVVVQWAQRDLTRAWGEGPKFSNYSLQANDYTTMGLGTNYFAKLVGNYLDGQNKIGQVTIGLETGQESVGNLVEYKNQLDYLAGLGGLKIVTMKEFGERFREIYPDWPMGARLKDEESEWEMTPKYRKNEYLHELTSYGQELSFSDNFVVDKSSFLERKLPLNNKNVPYIPYWIAVMIIVAIWQRSWRGGLLSILIWWPIFRSFGQNGWWVYFGPKIGYWGLIQAGLAGVGVVVFKKVKVNGILLVGGIAILNYLRITVLGGVKYVGFLIDAFRFIGVSSKGWVNRDFEGYAADSMLKFRWEWVWGRWWVWLLAYPLVIIILGRLLGKLPGKVRVVVKVVLVILLVTYVKDLLMADPIAVEAMR